MKIGRVISVTGKVTGGIIAFVMILLLAIYCILLLPPVQQYLLKISQPLINNLLQGTLTVGSVSSDLLTSAIVKNIEVRDTVTGRNVIYVNKAKIAFWLPALIFKGIINSVIIDQLSIRGQQVPGHTFIIPVVPKQKNPVKVKANSQWQVKINDIYVKQLEAHYVDSTQGVYVNIPKVKAKICFYKIDSIAVSIMGHNVNIETPWYVESLDTVNINSRIIKNGMLIDNVTLSGKSSYLRVEGLLPFTPDGLWNLNGLFDIRSENCINQSNSTVQTLQLQGAVMGDLHWGGSMAEPDLKLNIKAKNIGTKYQIFDTLTIANSYNGGQLSSTIQLFSKDLGGRIEARADIPNVFSKPYLGNYTTSVRIKGFVGRNLRGLIPGSIRLNPVYISLVSSVYGNGVHIPDTGYADVKIIPDTKAKEGIDIEARLMNNKWNLSGAWAGNTVVGEGNITDNNYFSGITKISLNDPQLISTILLGQEIKGQIQSELSFELNNRHLKMNTELGCKDLQWKDVVLDTLTGGVSYNNNQLSFQNIRARIHGNFDSLLHIMEIDSCGGQGKIDFEASGIFPDVKARAVIMSDRAYYKRFLVQSLTGEIMMSTIDTFSWNDLSVENSTSKIVTSGKCHVKPDIVIDMNTKFIQKGKSAAQKQPGSLNVALQLIKKSIKGSLKASDLDLQFFKDWFSLKQDISGIVNLQADVNGSLKNPQIESIFYIRSPGLEKIIVPGIKGQINMTDSMVDLSGLVMMTDSLSHVQFSAVLPVRPGLGWSIDTSGNRQRFIKLVSDTFDVQEINTTSNDVFSVSGPLHFLIVMSGSQGPWNIDGKLSLFGANIHYNPYDMSVSNTNANITIQGSTQSPDIVFNMTTGSADAGKELISGSQVNGKFKGNKVLIDSGAIYIQSRKALSIKGAVPIAAIEQWKTDTSAFIDYRISAFPLQILEIFLPGIYIADGYVNGNGELFIRNGHLQSKGDLTLRNCIVETEIIDQKIGPVNGDIMLSGDTISLANWEGRINKGKFTIDGFGKILQNGMIEVSANLKGKNITVDMPDLVNIQIESADLKLENGKQKNNYVLQGTVNFGPTRFIRNINLNDLVSSSNLPKNKYQKKSIFDSILLQLNLQFQDNLYVDMNLGNMQLNGALALSGNMDEPSFVGSINAVTGQIFYLDRTFEIQKGNLTFENPLEVNPSIYLEAKTEVTTFVRGATQSIIYNINLVVTGNLQHPIVTFTSVPPLNEPNIISVMTLGTTLGSVGSDIGSRIGSLAGNEILGFGTKKLGRLLNLESLTVSGNLFNSQDKKNEPQLTVTKRLSDRLTLSYETAIGNFNQQTISILYRLFPFLFLAGQTDNSGNSNINLKFRIYR